MNWLLHIHRPLYAKRLVFVPIRFVEKVDDAIGRVKVRVFTRGLETWAILPSESQEHVLVRDRDIS